MTVTVHPQTATILVVNWTQAMSAEQTWLEFSFTGSTVMKSRAKAGATGTHRDVVLGVPSATAVTLRIVSRQGGVDYKTHDYTGTTGALPTGMPKPTLLAYNAALASPDRYMFGSVEDSSGGCTTRNCYFDGQFWVYIMDRQARIVWYYADASSNAATGFQRIARDGEYIWIDKSRMGTRGVMKMTLDRQYMQTIALPIGDAIDVTTDGALLYDSNNELREMNKAGTIAHDLELPDRVRRVVQLLHEHRELEPGRRHRADVVPGAEHRRPDQPPDRRDRRDLRRPRRAATRFRPRPGRWSGSTSRTSPPRGR